MIADISLPPFTTLLLILGALLVVVALAGKITIKEAAVGIDQPYLRCLAGIIGAGLIGVAVWLFAPALGSHAIESKNPSPTSAVSPSVSAPAVPLTRANGKWSVTEKVRPEYGGYEIVWTYDAVVLGSQLTMQGKKKIVRQPSSSEDAKLSADEKATVSVFTLDVTGLNAEGTYDETDSHNAHNRGTLKIHFSDRLESFSGVSQAGGSDVSTLMGSKQ
jgi:hypothetical protein